MLLLDVGNSAVKCRLLDEQGHRDAVFSMRENDYLNQLNHFLEKIDINQIVLASVASQDITLSICAALKAGHSSIPITRLETQSELDGLKNTYDDYQQMGVDRWLTLVAAHDSMRRDCLIVDAGTAIKIELLSKQLGYLGGAILPGFNTDLARFKSLFPAIDFTKKDNNAPCRRGLNTFDCLCIPQSTMCVELVLNIMQDWLALLDKSAEVLFCGQDAKLVALEYEGVHRIESDLVFKGMLKQFELLR